jgi:hypothetical protein
MKLNESQAQEEASRRRNDVSTSSMSLAIAMLRNLYQNESPPTSPLPWQPQAQPLSRRANLHSTIQAALDLISDGESDLDLDEDSEENSPEEFR